MRHVSDAMRLAQVPLSRRRLGPASKDRKAAMPPHLDVVRPSRGEARVAVEIVDQIERDTVACRDGREAIDHHSIGRRVGKIRDHANVKRDLRPAHITKISVASVAGRAISIEPLEEPDVHCPQRHADVRIVQRGEDWRDPRRQCQHPPAAGLRTQDTGQRIRVASAPAKLIPRRLALRDQIQSEQARQPGCATNRPPFGRTRQATTAASSPNPEDTR